MNTEHTLPAGIPAPPAGFVFASLGPLLVKSAENTTDIITFECGEWTDNHGDGWHGAAVGPWAVRIGSPIAIANGIGCQLTSAACELEAAKKDIETLAAALDEIRGMMPLSYASKLARHALASITTLRARSADDDGEPQSSSCSSQKPGPGAESLAMAGKDGAP